MIITLCGSSRFEAAYHHWNMKLSLMGHVVIGMTSYPSLHEGVKDWFTTDVKEKLDDVHKRKIDVSDLVFIIDTAETEFVAGGVRHTYVGLSTMSEVWHAKRRAKPIIHASQELYKPSIGSCWDTRQLNLI